MTENDSTRLRRRFTVALDFRDVLGTLGAAIIIAGAWMMQPGLAVVAIGATVVGVAWRLAREP